jgi:hypothetical protein
MFQSSLFSSPREDAETAAERIAELGFRMFGDTLFENTANP